MITRIGTQPRHRALTIEQFQNHWTDVHAPLVAKLKGLRRYWQNHALLRDGEPLLGWPGMDACAELDFDSLAAMDAGFDDEEFERSIASDTKYLINELKFEPMFTQRIALAGKPDGSGVRLLTFLRCAAGRTRADLESGLRRVPAAARARARELYMPLADGNATRPVSAFDALDSQWFETAAHAERYAVSAEAREHRHEITHLIQGVERMIVQVRTII